MLAIVEEVGVAGFIFYLALLYAIWGSMRQSVRLGGSRTVYMIGLGFFFASLFHSAFEAWFISSGPDVAVYWCTIGLILGSLSVYSRTANDRLARMETAPRPSVLASPITPR